MYYLYSVLCNRIRHNCNLWFPKTFPMLSVSICSEFLFLFVLQIFAAHFCVLLHCEYWQYVYCQIDEDVFLICRHFFLFACVFLVFLFAAC